MRWRIPKACMRTLAFAVMTCVATVGAVGAEPCPAPSGCAVANGHYHAYVPATPARRIVLFFHGYGSSGRHELSIAAFRQWAEHEQVILLLPDGLDARWSVVSGGSGTRDDVAFAEEVLADARRRWPLADLPVVASGFSLGGSMVWKLACTGRPTFAGYVAFSGAFWEPAPTECSVHDVPMFHVHGTDDVVVPLQGRAVRSGARQAPVAKAFTALQRAKLCAEPPVHLSVTDAPAPLACLSAAECRRPGAFVSCQHAEGHSFRLDWLTYALSKMPPGER